MDLSDTISALSREPLFSSFHVAEEGEFPAHDGHVDGSALYAPILNVLQQESLRYASQPHRTQQVVVTNEDGVTYARISMDHFRKVSQLQQAALQCNTPATDAATVEAFRQQTGGTSWDAPAEDPTDLPVVIHDVRTSKTPLSGLRIDSPSGTPATLLPTGTPTNFLFELTGASLTDEQIQTLNAIDDPQSRMEGILKAGCRLTFVEVEHETFRNHLLFLDTGMPSFLADCLLYASMPDSQDRVPDVVAHVTGENPLHYKGSNLQAFYAHKMKLLLLDAALGMTSATEGTDSYDTCGEYLVVRTDGDTACYHLYHTNDLEDYLFHHTRFDHASRSTPGFGTVFRADDGKAYLRLNLQIRFLK